jgi:hypothetical protein
MLLLLGGNLRKRFIHPTASTRNLPRSFCLATGSYNLDGNYATKIQDTLAEFIVKKLTYVG